jgi:hypothetical protein
MNVRRLWPAGLTNGMYAFEGDMFDARYILLVPIALNDGKFPPNMTPLIKD